MAESPLSGVNVVLVMAYGSLVSDILNALLGAINDLAMYTHHWVQSVRDVPLASQLSYVYK